MPSNLLNINKRMKELQEIKIDLDAIRDVLQERVIGDGCHRIALNRALEALVTLDEVWDEIVWELN